MGTNTSLRTDQAAAGNLLLHFRFGRKVKKGDVKKGSPLTDKAYDGDMSFMLVEVNDKQMHFQFPAHRRNRLILELSPTVGIENDAITLS